MKQETPLLWRNLVIYSLENSWGWAFCLLLVARYFWLVARYFLLLVRFFLLITFCSLLVIFCSLLVFAFLPSRCVLLFFIPGVTQEIEDAGWVQDFILLFLCFLWIGRIRRQGQFMVLLCNPSSEKFLLRPSSSCNKSLDRVSFRILSNSDDGAVLQK